MSILTYNLKRAIFLFSYGINVLKIEKKNMCMNVNLVIIKLCAIKKANGLDICLNFNIYFFNYVEIMLK